MCGEFVLLQGFNKDGVTIYCHPLLFNGYVKIKEMMNKETWSNISIREKMQLINGTLLIWAAIVLYFLAFILTMTIGLEVVSAGATLLATGLAFFGVSSFIKNQMVHFETNIDERIKKIERKHYDDTERRGYPDNEERDL